MPPFWEGIGCATAGTDSANTGIGKCAVDFTQLSYVIAVPRGTIITAAELADFANTLETKAHLDNPNERWYLLGQFVGYEAADVAPTTETATNQQTRITSMGSMGYTLQQWEGGICAYKVLLKFDLSQDRFEFLNVFGNVVQGVYTTDSTGKEAMRGITMSQVYTNTIGLPTGAAGAQYKIQFKVGDSKQMRELLTTIQMPDGFDIAGAMRGIVDVKLVGGPTTPVGSFKITAFATCGGVSLATTYPTELADPDAWLVRDVSTGAEVPVTSAVVLGDYITLTTGQTTGSVSIQLAPLSDLEDLGIIGFESNALVVPVS